MPTPMQSSYDQVPYDSFPFPQTHPDRLATIATLLGLTPPPVERCRVLELGCAAGGNLIPLALCFPNSTFLGIDLSQVQINEGKRTIGDLGLKNIELRQASILDVDSSYAKFDYILCHGVYSWVSDEIQDQILGICKENLSPKGIAFLSYNTYPGWHMRGMIRDMMIYHARQFAEAKMKVQQARNLLNFLVNSAGKQSTPYSFLLKAELEAIQRSSDAYLYHEHLEDINEPIYFYQFAERAAAKGLRYLGEAELQVMVPANFPPEIASVLQMVSPDHIHLEQYMDFLRNRMFRQSLLCHDDLKPNYALTGDRIFNLYLASSAKPVAAATVGSTQEPLKFETAAGITLESREPLVKTAMIYLSEIWPRTVPFRELLAEVRRRLGTNVSKEIQGEADAQNLGTQLLGLYGSASSVLIEFHFHPPLFSTTISERPLASTLARWQAIRLDRVTNLRHEVVPIGEMERHVLRYLDGNHDREAIISILTDLAEQGQLSIENAKDEEERKKELRMSIEKVLSALAQKALLMR